MAYTIIKVSTWGFRDPFKETEDDHSFKTRSYPELDDYLTSMESRGWKLVTVNPLADGVSVWITFHRDEQ